MARGAENERSGHWGILLAIGMGTFMTALDGSVANTILPVLREHFDSSVATIEWVVTLYLLVISGLLLSFGRLGDLRGHKQVYVWGFAIFVAGSILCGLAPGIAPLLAFRAVQALGAAMLAANSPAILTKNFPPSRRGRVLGLASTMTYLGLLTGPSLGGWLTTAYGWRWVFYINVPVGLLGLVLSVRFIPHDAGSKSAERFDLAGATLFTVGLVALLLGLNRGHAWGWTSPATWAMLALAALALIVFVAVELRHPSPMLDMSMFRNRIFSAATLSAVLNYVCVYSIIFLMPFYLIQARGLTPSQAGALLTAQPVIMAAMAPVSGTLSDRIGSRLLSTLGMGVLALALFLYAQLGPATPTARVAFNLALSGLGVGLFTSPNASAMMGAAPPERQGTAAGIQATARNVGMALGVGLTGAIFNTFLEHTSTFAAIRTSFGAIVVVAVVGMLTSALRGRLES